MRHIFGVFETFSAHVKRFLAHVKRSSVTDGGRQMPSWQLRCGAFWEMGPLNSASFSF